MKKAMNTTLLHIRRFSGHDNLQKAVRDILALRADKKRIGIPYIERVSSYELRELLVFHLQWGHSSRSETILCSTELTRFICELAEPASQF